MLMKLPESSFRCWSVCLCLLGVALLSKEIEAQAPQPTEKELVFSPKSASEYDVHFRLLPFEEDQEVGNAVPVLLRMTYEQQRFMSNLYSQAP